MRITNTEAATKFIKEHFSGCDLAILAGSTVRNAATATSDLDIVVIDHGLKNCYRESFIQYGWPIEVFVHSNQTVASWIEKDIARRKPSMPAMIAEGQLMTGSESEFLKLQNYAKSRLGEGPAPFSDEEDLAERYFLTDLLDDFIGSTNHVDDVFILNQVLERLVNFKLVKIGQWTVHGKRIQRALRTYDPQFADRLIITMTAFYQSGNKQEMIELLESVLLQYGGRVFEGYSAGKT